MSPSSLSSSPMSPPSLSHMSQYFIHFLAFFLSLQSFFLHCVFFVSSHVLPPLSSLSPSSLSPSPMSPSSLSSSPMSPSSLSSSPMSPSSLSHMSQYFIHFLAFFLSLQSFFLHCVFFVSLHVLPPLSSLSPWPSLSSSPM